MFILDAKWSSENIPNVLFFILYIFITPQFCPLQKFMNELVL